MMLVLPGNLLDRAKFEGWQKLYPLLKLTLIAFGITLVSSLHQISKVSAQTALEPPPSYSEKQDCGEYSTNERLGVFTIDECPCVVRKYNINNWRFCGDAFIEECKDEAFWRLEAESISSPRSRRTFPGEDNVTECPDAP